MEQGNIFQLNAQPQKASLDLPQADPNALYLIDFSKITSVNDLVLILASMGISFAGSHPHFEQIKQFVDLSKPIQVQQAIPQQPQGKEISLPKLKPVK